VKQAQRFHQQAIRNNHSPSNGEARWTLITNQTLNMFLSRLVEPLRLFYPDTGFGLMAMPPSFHNNLHVIPHWALPKNVGGKRAT